MKRKQRMLTVVLTYLLVLAMPLSAVAMPLADSMTFEHESQYVSSTLTGPGIRVCELTSQLEYHVGDSFNWLATTVLIYDNGAEVVVTNPTYLTATVRYVGTEVTIAGITASQYGFYGTGPRIVDIFFDDGTDQWNYEFEVNVLGHRLYRELEFDLFIGVEGQQRWGTPGRRFPAAPVFTMLDVMEDGRAFDWNWALDPAVIVHVDFINEGPALAVNTNPAHSDFFPALRLGVIRGDSVTGALGGRDSAYWNTTAAGANPPVQDRHYGSRDIRHRFAIQRTDGMVKNNGSGLAIPPVAGSAIGSFQGFPIDFFRRDVPRNLFRDIITDPYGGQQFGVTPFYNWHYLVLFSGGNLTNQAGNYVTRVSLAMTEDRTAPWEAGYVPAVVTGIDATTDSAYPYMVAAGSSIQLYAESIGTGCFLPYLVFEVTNSDQVFVICPLERILRVPFGVTEPYLNIRISSLQDLTVYTYLTIYIEVVASDHPIPVYYRLRFNHESSWSPLHNIASGNGADGREINRTDAHTLPRQSMYFHPGWFRPGVVAMVTLDNPGAHATHLNNIQFGIRRRSPQATAALAGVPFTGTPGSGGHAWANLPVSTNGADRYTHVIIDPALGTAQVTFEAFRAGLAPADQVLLDAGQFYAMHARLSPSPGGTVVGRLSLATTSPTYVPWLVPLTTTVISDDMPDPGPLPTGHVDPTHPSGRSLSTFFPGDFGIGGSPYVFRWDDFSETAVGQITNVGQLNVGRHRWDGVRIQNGSPGTEANMFIVARDDDYTPAGPGQGAVQPISGAACEYFPGDQAVVFWTNSEGPQHFSLELQHQLTDNYARMLNETGQVFIRFYQYWAPNSAINGSSHNGVTMSALDRYRIADGTAFGGNDFLIPNGYDWFNIIYEFVRAGNPGLYVPEWMHGRPDIQGPMRSAGQVAMYMYYSWQSSMTNRPTGHVWGDLFFADGSRGGSGFIANYGAPFASHFNAQGNPTGRGTAPHRNPTAGGVSPDFFQPRPAFWQENAVWHSLEFMVRPNTVCEITGEVRRDGRVTGWIDGEVVMDFPNIVLRYTEELMINVSRLLLINSPNIAEAGRETYKMVTQYVMATRYIGPMYRFRHAVRACEYIAELEEFVVNYDLSIVANLEEAIEMFEHANALVDALPASNDELDSLQARLDAIWAIITAVQGQPIFSWNIFNNGPGGEPSRPNPGLAASGTIRMWTQLDGVNAPVYLDAADTIVALDQNGQCALEFVRVNRMWVAGTGWSDYFNMVDVSKNSSSWQYINLYIAVYGQTVHVLLANALFEDAPAVPKIVSVAPNPVVLEQGGEVEIVVTTQGMPAGAWVDLNAAWRHGLSIVGGPRFYIVDNQAIITVAAAENAQLGRDGFAVAARVEGNWGSVAIVDSYTFVIEIK